MLKATRNGRETITLRRLRALENAIRLLKEKGLYEDAHMIAEIGMCRISPPAALRILDILKEE